MTVSWLAVSNLYNEQLLAGGCKDFRSAMLALKGACLHELRKLDANNSDESNCIAVFQKSVEDCDKAIEIYDRLFPEFQKRLVNRLMCAALDDFAMAADTNDFKELGF